MNNLIQNNISNYSERTHLNIIQWNIRGLKAHLNYIHILNEKYKNSIFCIQETKLKENNLPNFKNFKTFYKNKLTDTIAHGGVAFIISNSIACSEVKLQSNLKVIAIEIYNPIKMTIINLYLDKKIRSYDLENIIKQIKQPFIILGDLNAHNPLWGSKKERKRNRKFYTIKFIKYIK